MTLLVLAGTWLDERYGTSPLWTLILSLFGIVGGMVSLVYQVIGKK